MLVVLSLILVTNTLFPAIDVPTLTAILFAASAGALIAGGIGTALGRRPRRAAGLPGDPLAGVRNLDSDTWRMPRLE